MSGIQQDFKIEYPMCSKSTNSPQKFPLIAYTCSRCLKKKINMAESFCLRYVNVLE